MARIGKFLERLLRRPEVRGSDLVHETAALTAWLSDLLDAHIDRGYQPGDQELAHLRGITPEHLVAACPGLAFSKATVLRKWLTPEQRAAVTAWLDAHGDLYYPAKPG